MENNPITCERLLLSFRWAQPWARQHRFMQCKCTTSVATPCLRHVQNGEQVREKGGGGAKFNSTHQRWSCNPSKVLPVVQRLDTGDRAQTAGSERPPSPALLPSPLMPVKTLHTRGARLLAQFPECRIPSSSMLLEGCSCVV
jgi:hypothetical protein